MHQRPPQHCLEALMEMRLGMHCSVCRKQCFGGHSTAICRLVTGGVTWPQLGNLPYNPFVALGIGMDQLNSGAAGCAVARQ